MPIRPALASLTMRGPRPAESRRVACPHCGHAFSLSRKALSATCPRCTRHLQFQDLDLTDRMEGDLSTMGHVNVQAPSQIVGRVVCGQLTNQGCFKGRAVVYGPANILAGSRTDATLTARSLTVQRGSVMRGKVHITPDPKASPLTRAVAERKAHHPVRKAMRLRAS